MNRRIRKKKDKKKITEAINGLVLIAERQEQQRQAAIRQFVNGVKPCMSSSEQKGGIDAVTKKKTTYRIRAPTKIPIAHPNN